MARVRQTQNTQSTITVETDSGQSLILTIVSENSGVYAVNYEEDNKHKAGQFVDAEDAQELYESSKDDTFDGYDEGFQVHEISNDGSMKWVCDTD